MASATTSKQLIAAARKLSCEIDRLRFSPPVVQVYNPLNYAWKVHEEYLRRFGNTPKRVLFLGMNPGPFGMCQTGIPFGEIRAVREWMQLHGRVEKPPTEHPKRPILGFDCTRSEVSGHRLYKLFAERFGSADNFFQEHFVVNYCPLAFCEESGCNRTPDKLPAKEKAALFAACDEHLHSVLRILKPQWVVGVGGFAAEKAREVAEDLPLQIGQILHPSPASPAANRNWSGLAAAELERLGIWNSDTK